MIIKGRTFIISGGASGLGLATAHLLTAKGGYVAILDLPTTDVPSLLSSFPPDLEPSTTSSSPQPHERVQFFPCDVTSSSSLSTAITSTAFWISNTTHAALAGIIACAGISSPAKIIDRDGHPMDLSPAQAVLAVNVLGTLDLIRLALPHLVAVPPHGDGERGVVIMVSSSAAFDGQPGQVAYAASKGAIRSATLPMARDLARYGVRVVSIAPGLFETGMTRGMGGRVREGLLRAAEWPRRAGRADEFAHLVGAVVENAMLNGECVRLDGGVRMPSKI